MNLMNARMLSNQGLRANSMPIRKTSLLSDGQYVSYQKLMLCNYKHCFTGDLFTSPSYVLNKRFWFE